jgi:hypothetical protein
LLLDLGELLLALRSARVLHNTVERDELGYDNPAHVVFLLVCSGGRSGCPGIIIKAMVDKPVG